MKFQLPALIMLLSEFRKPIRTGGCSPERDISPSWRFGIEPTPAAGEAGVPDSTGATSVYGTAPPHEACSLTPPISRDAPWTRSKKKRFG
jgi:hypothetical protein